MTILETTVPVLRYDDDATLFLRRVLHNYLGKELALEVLKIKNDSRVCYLDRKNKIVYHYDTIVSPTSTKLVFNGRKAFVAKETEGFYLSSKSLFYLELELGYRGLFHTDKTLMSEIKDFLDENIEKSKTLKNDSDYMYIDKLYVVTPFEER
jgi:hypothetical protein